MAAACWACVKAEGAGCVTEAVGCVTVAAICVACYGCFKVPDVASPVDVDGHDYCFVMMSVTIVSFCYVFYCFSTICLSFYISGYS